MTTQPTLTPAAFAQKWQGTTTTAKAGSQEHFDPVDCTSYACLQYVLPFARSARSM